MLDTIVQRLTLLAIYSDLGFFLFLYIPPEPLKSFPVMKTFLQLIASNQLRFPHPVLWMNYTSVTQLI